MVGIHGQQFVGADQRDRNDIHLRLDGQKESSLQKRLNLSIRSAAALGENHQRHACLQTLHCRADTGNRFRGLLLINADLPGSSQVPADDGILQQLLLKSDPKLEWQVNVEHGDVERGTVTHGVDVGPGSVDLLQPGDRYRREDGLHDQPGPDMGKVVLDAATIAENRTRQREQTHHDRVQPD